MTNPDTKPTESLEEKVERVILRITRHTTSYGRIPDKVFVEIDRDKLQSEVASLIQFEKKANRLDELRRVLEELTHFRIRTDDVGYVDRKLMQFGNVVEARIKEINLMDEINYNCGKFSKKVQTYEAWNTKHRQHGHPTFEEYHKRFQWRVCPCGARLLEVKESANG